MGRPRTSAGRAGARATFRRRTENPSKAREEELAGKLEETDAGSPQGRIRRRTHH